MPGQMVLTIPNASDWLTRGAAAEILDVDPTTVLRMVKAGRLQVYWPARAVGEWRPFHMFWRGEVEALAQARKIAREGVHAA